MQIVLVIEQDKVKDAYEFNVEQGFMVRQESLLNIAVEEIEEKLAERYGNVSKIREIDNEIVYEVT